MLRNAFVVLSLVGLFAAAAIGLPAIRAAFRGTRGEARAPRAAVSNGESVVAAGGMTTRETTRDPGKSPHRSARVGGVLTRHTLPTDLFDVEQLHRQPRRNWCAALPAGTPINPSQFTPYLSDDPTGRSALRSEALSSRRTILTIGIDMTRQDRRELPTLSGGKILDFLTSQYVVIQARILKDPVTGEEYLDHRPVAGIASFAQPGVAVEPQAALAHSLQQYRGVGLFVRKGEDEFPANLRTLVLLNRTERATSSEGDETEPRYEYVFVRARASGDSPGDALQLSVFGTSDGRTKLHWFRDRLSPRRVEDCTVTTFVRFTKYSYAGLLPEKSVTRTSTTDVRASYLLTDLNAYAQRQGWGESAFDRLTDVLDAILDDRVNAKLGDLSAGPSP